MYNEFTTGWEVDTMDSEWILRLAKEQISKDIFSVQKLKEDIFQAYEYIANGFVKVYYLKFRDELAKKHSGNDFTVIATSIIRS